MPQLNLLPWREQQRHQKNKQFIIAAALSVTITLLVAAAVWGYLQQIKHTLTLANNLLIEKNSLLEVTKNKNQSIKQQRQITVAQLAEVERLAHHRNSLVQLWSELTAVIPATMYLTSFESQQGSLVLRGKSKQPGAVTKLVAYLQQNSAIQKAQVKYIKKPQSAAQATPYNHRHNQSTVDQQVETTIMDSTTTSHHFDFEVVAILFERQAKNNDSAPSTSINEAVTVSKEGGL